MDEKKIGSFYRLLLLYLITATIMIVICFLFLLLDVDCICLSIKLHISTYIRFILCSIYIYIYPPTLSASFNPFATRCLRGIASFHSVFSTRVMTKVVGKNNYVLHLNDVNIATVIKPECVVQLYGLF